MSRHAAFSGVTADKPPVIWKPEKHEQLPPFIYSLLGLPLLGPQFDIAPQSKTWTCTPEPNILYVRWYAGGTDEFYRLENQTFTIVKYTNFSPTSINTNRFSVLLRDSARLGEGHIHLPPFPRRYQLGVRAQSNFES